MESIDYTTENFTRDGKEYIRYTMTLPTRKLNYHPQHMAYWRNGFAIYLDLLEELMLPKAEFDIDTLLLYDQSTDLKKLSSVIKELTEQGLSVTAQRAIPEKLRYRQLVRLNESEVEILETNA